MSDPNLTPDDEAVLALARQLPRPVPGVADSARLKHGLEAALARDTAGRRHAVPPALVLAAVVAAGAASAGTALLLARPRGTPDYVATPTSMATSMATTIDTPARALAIDDGVAPGVSPAAPTPDAPMTNAAPNALATSTTKKKPTLQLPPPASISAPIALPTAPPAPPAPTAPTTAAVASTPDPPRSPQQSPPQSPSLPKPAPTWQERVDDLQARGDLHAAAAVAAAAVVDSDDPRAAGVAMWALSGGDPSVIDVLDPIARRLQGSGYDDDNDALARVLRLGCQLRLRHRRDVSAIATCRTFGQRFPTDPAARALAFAAGGLAEELGELRAAVDEYTRAIVLAPLMGSSGADALLARARVRTRLGDLDEARADLRVYLQKDRRPAATHDDEVQGLARALKVALP